MAISLSSLGQYALPQANINSDITPQLAALTETINKGQRQQTLAQLGQGLADGTINYQQAAGKLAATGDLAGSISLLQLGQKQHENAAAANAITQAYGGGSSSGVSASPSAPVAPGPTVPNDSNALPGQVGMDLRLADRSQDFIQDNPGTYLSSGYRSPADQARLYADRANNPNPVAPPGSSNHERGMAADIGGMTPEQRAQLPQYGLAQPVANDAPHVELADGAGTAPATTSVGIIGNDGPSKQQIAALAANPTTRPVALELLKAKMTGQKFAQETDDDGNIWNVNKTTGQKTVALKSSEAKNGGLINVASGGAIFDPKNRQVVFQNKPGATLDDETVSAMADQYLAGDRTVLQNLGRGAQGAENVVKLRTAIMQRAKDAGVNPQGIVDNFNEQAGKLAGQRAVGTRAANISLAANEANNMIGIAIDASDKVPRTQWMPINKAIQAYQKGSSSPELASFVAATNSLVNAYVRAVSPTGVPTDSMRQHAYDMLNSAQGPEAYKAVVSTMQKEMKAALSAPSQVRTELRGDHAAQQAQSSIQDGMTATNPQTGQKIVFRGGQWQPAQ